MAKKKGENYNSDDDQEYSDEPNFDDPEGFVDDVTDEELLADFLKQKPCESDGVENVIVVDNIPVVAADRFPKLKGIMEKIFKNAGTIVNVYYPKDEEDNTKGYAFIEYKNAESAEEAVKTLNNYRLDKHYTLLVNRFSDFQKYSDIPKEWSPPEPQPYKVQNDLYNFLVEPDAQDHFCVVSETTPGSVQVQFCQNTQPEPTELLKRERFTDTYVKWSPKGTYIVTFHKQGVIIWGGSSFVKVNKFAHGSAQFVDISPCEQYLVTYGPNGQKIVIWDIRTGAEKRSFVSDGTTNASMLRWSHDDRYVARLVDNQINIYDTSTFFLLDMKSIKVEGIRNFGWSPTDNIIAYWVAEEVDVPAKVTLLAIPKKIELRTKNLFNVADCKIHWQNSGDYLCVKVDRFSKSKKDKKDKKDSDVKFLGMFYNFEIFHMREKDIPVDSVEVKETILAFAWEPVGSKFAIIHGEPSSSSISFYEAKKGQEPALVKKMEKKVCSHLFWSPRGQFIVMANLQMGSFEFVDTNDFSIMKTGDHYRACEVEWDPTGRYVVTGTSGKAKEDQGYYLWSFQGRIIRRVTLKNFMLFLWRPRPPTLLSEQKQKDIRKNLKKYYAQFETKDRLRMTRASKELIEKRAKLREQFTEYRTKRVKEWEEQKYRRMQLRNNVDTDTLEADPENAEEEVVEMLVREDTTIIE
ncbi:eukaryotic translation initiation factor 3 subunit B [Anopheles albimanus]|uniref:Eukaryotic translation initiation factor 3 subunit B n=1 Tax=Anopheles albimanus TaxID=7167 RepID=A0A182FW25_ANOAL|nr:eukaryotic translation initiation factor 3 subunit B [Anopheles albimanus]